MTKSFRVLLLLNGFTVKEFVAWSGKSKSTVYRWMRNDRCPKFYEYVLNYMEIARDEDMLRSNSDDE